MELACFVIEISQRVTATNMAARLYARAPGRPGCDDILLKSLNFVYKMTQKRK